MTAKPTNDATFPDLRGQGGGTGLVTLVIGEIQRWQANGRVLPRGAEFVFLEFGDLTGPVLAGINPDIVLSPLVLSAADASDIARALHSAGFKGRYRVIVASMPDVDVITAEIAEAAPGLDFAIHRWPVDQTTRPPG